MNESIIKYIVEIPIIVDGEHILHQNEFDAMSENDAYKQAVELIQSSYLNSTINEIAKMENSNIFTSADVIKTDEDTSEADRDELVAGIYPYDPNYSSIQIEDIPFTVFEYLRQLEKGKIIIQPEFQRKQVWKPVQKSKFIESIILNFPLPPIYLNETKDNKYVVIDGLQRTTALYQFFKSGFKLTGLEALPKYNGETFDKLSEQIQSKLENKRLTVFALKPSTPSVVIYDLFNRINTGGTQLNRQEVRNCIFIGKSTRLLKDLSEQKYFKDAIGNGVSGMRMKDREVILRYIAFRWSDFMKEYTGDMSAFVEEAMRKINQMDEKTILEIKDDFKRVMTISFKIWGGDNFRIPTEKTRGVINTAVLESVCYFISSYSNDFINKNKLAIKQNYSTLINNDKYRYSVMRATGNKNSVHERFRIAKEILSLNTTTND